MGFKKYDGSTWQPITPKKLKGIPYTGTLPATLTGTKAGYLHSYKIYGNTEQTVTPTPENPIEPSECGERTENLFTNDFSQFDNTGGTGTTYAYFYVPENFTLTMIAKDDHTVPANTYLGISKYGGTASNVMWVISPGKSVIEGNRSTIASATTEYHYVSMYPNNISIYNWIQQHYYIMLVEGLTAPTEYIPYGYKLPLISAGQNVDIFIGTKPLRKIGNYADYIDYGTGKIVRQVGKVVLTGTETNYGIENTPYDGTKAISYLYSKLGMANIINFDKQMNTIPYPSYGSTHYVLKNHNRNSWTNIKDGEIGANNYSAGMGNKYLIFGTLYQTANEFKQFLADQYAAETPVEIWYPLATPVEEDPPMSFPQIPTSAGSTTISWAGEGLAPSEFDSIHHEWVDIATYTYTNGEWVADN